MELYKKQKVITQNYLFYRYVTAQQRSIDYHILIATAYAVYGIEVSSLLW